MNHLRTLADAERCPSCPLYSHDKKTMPAVLLVAAFAATAIHTQPANAEPIQRPNIVFIMADDMGVDWVHSYGAAQATPNIDRLASQGVRFSNVWCNPICTPTRLTLLTGMYPFRTGWINHHDVPRWGGKGFDWEQYTCWARVLRDAGYATAIGGKWQVNDFRKYPDALQRHGFDEHCVWTGYETGNAPPSDKRYWDAYLMTNGQRKKHEGEFGPTVVNDFLIDFIRRHKDVPFLVYYPMMMPHGPYTPTPLNKQNPPQGASNLYAGMVTYVDSLVGRITKTIDELGLGANTLIVFTGDNGSSTAGRMHNKPYAKGKGKVTNYGAHVPFVARAPFLTGDNIGRVSDDLIDFSDIYPTFVRLAGAKMPQGPKFDGFSFVESVRGTSSQKRAWIYSQLGKGRMVRGRRYLLDNRGGFYDLRTDPLQSRNLADSNDPAAAAARKVLQTALDAMPPDAGPPFDLYGVHGGAKKKPKSKQRKNKRAKRGAAEK